MSINVNFYTDQDVDFVNKRIEEIKKKTGDLFVKSFSLMSADEMNSIDNAILKEDAGGKFNGASTFIMGVGRYREDFSLDDAINYIKKEFSDINIIEFVE